MRGTRLNEMADSDDYSSDFAGRARRLADQRFTTSSRRSAIFSRSSRHRAPDLGSSRTWWAQVLVGTALRRYVVARFRAARHLPSGDVTRQPTLQVVDMVDEEGFATWARALRSRRPGSRIDTRDAADRQFISFALSEGLAIVTTPPGDVSAADAPYVLGVRLTPNGERVVARHTRR
jgi:hypothetical protein